MLKLLFSTICLFMFLSCSKDSEGLKQLSNFPISDSVTDIWGYVGSDGKEYAIVGFGLFLPAASPNSGFVIIDVTNPETPTQVARVTGVPGFDVKVWRNYVYTVDGGITGSGGIVDIADPANPQLVGGFPSSHNIFISDTGYMYASTCGGAGSCNQPARIYNLNPDPTRPVLAWNGERGGHDETVVGNRWYNFGASGDTRIYDISDQTRPQLLGAIDDPQISFNHSGWPTDDGNVLFICDELADLNGAPADFSVWDISDLNNPQKIGEFADIRATVHNLFVIGDFAYVSYYSAGFRIFDISDPANPKIAAEFDTLPASSDVNFRGAFGVYPFAPSGNIYVSDQETGLHVFSFAPAGLGGSNPVAP